MYALIFMCKRNLKILKFVFSGSYKNFFFGVISFNLLH